ncbi:flagellar basal-body rod protein FlgF [Chthonobacter albigriseus]|uniref:flagellar basal-body rod protein FlgF n=1 Tax=Chthonobacter albigriseus TaxID=1683161 RepID=UPI0015EE877A|nr:flagellar basal-body rod protein FlgF [Chthonobacter albigriseus]
MENTSLVALSRQLVLRRKLDVIANNVANLDTVGYKRLSLELDEYKMPVARANTFQRRDQVHSFVEDWNTTADFEEGPTETTGNPLDVVIQGDAFFVVMTEGGQERYTRAGNFQIDETGRLVTADGHAVMGEGGEIVFAANEKDVLINNDGTVATNVGPRGSLRLVSFADDAVLSHQGDNTFSASGTSLPATDFMLKQGSIEKSNVEGIIELTRLMEVTRAYESVSKMISEHDDLRSKAIERLGDTTA